jgi:hypothetical protein
MVPHPADRRRGAFAAHAEMTTSPAIPAAPSRRAPAGEGWRTYEPPSGRAAATGRGIVPRPRTRSAGEVSHDPGGRHIRSGSRELVCASVLTPDAASCAAVGRFRRECALSVSAPTSEPGTKETSPKPVPREHPVHLAARRSFAGRLFKRFGRAPHECGSTDPLLCKGGALRFQFRQQNPPICGRFFYSNEPSDGLEPSTPSLPWRIRASATRPMNGAC